MAKASSKTKATGDAVAYPAPQTISEATQAMAQSESSPESSTMPTHLTPVKYTGGKPRIGDRCLYWMAQSDLTGGGLRPRPADITGFERGGCNVNIQRSGGSMYSKNGLRFSDTPRHDCLTWLEAQDEWLEAQK